MFFKVNFLHLFSSGVKWVSVFYFIFRQCAVLPPYLTLSVCDRKNEDDQETFGTLAGGCAPEARTQPL